MKKNLYGKACILMILTIFLYIGCSENTYLNVGFIGSLSGKKSDLGFFARNAVQLCVDEFNKKGGVKGRKVRLIIEDNGGDPKLCEEKLNSLMKRGVKFVIGPLISQMAEKTLKTTKNKDILIMSPSMSTPFLSGRDDNIIRTIYETTEQSTILAKYMIKEGERKIGIIYDLDNRGYTEPLYKEFAKLLKKRNRKLSLVRTIHGGTKKSFIQITEEVLKTKLDAVLLCISATDAATFSQHLRKRDKKIKLYGVLWTQTSDLINYGGKAVEGMHLVSIFKNKKRTKKFLEFKKRFSSKFGKKSSFISILAYDATDILLSSMGRAEELSPESVKKAILNTKIFSGLNSDIIFDKFGDTHGKYTITKIINGRYVNVTD